MKTLSLVIGVALALQVSMMHSVSSAAGGLTVTELRCEYLVNPVGIDAAKPRLSWRVESSQRGQLQTAYQLIVSSSRQGLEVNQPVWWDSGKVSSSETLHIEYGGPPLQSGRLYFWKVRSWDRDGQPSAWSEPASWAMGLLADADWKAEYISYRDDTPVHRDVDRLHLPAARQYRKEFNANKPILRATVYATALGIYELYLNGKRVGDHYFSPGWTDYRQRAYYNSFDVTSQVIEGNNAIGAWVADGWYSGYVGFGLLTGMGTEKTGRSIYGKTPAMMAQLVIEYADGTQQIVVTDSAWKVTDEGPIQEADLLMGEAYDAQREQRGWSEVGFDDSSWDAVILAKDNPSVAADFYEFQNPTPANPTVHMDKKSRELGFKRPVLEAFPGVPVRITEEIKAKSIQAHEDGTYIVDMGQNFAGNIRLRLKGPAGHTVQIRYGEMLHPDGRLMTENLRKARATDFYTCRGDEQGETYSPRFTFHGFQYVELSHFPGEPSLETVTGLVLHSDTPMVSTFECSDLMVNRLYQNVLWTQRANFIDLPTDCPQRDERMGWTGDAQAYVGTAALNADIGAFYTKWLRELMESQRPSGAFPGYAPFPFQHGWDFGTAWADAGVICPWTLWQVYGDRRVIDHCWEPMTRFMQWRKKTSVNDLGIAQGNAWGDWLTQGASTPLDYIDTIYFAISAKMMSEMALATGRESEALQYQEQFQRTKAAFAAKYLNPDGSVNVRTQTAQALALFADLIPVDQREATGRYLAELIAENGNHMTTGFLGTRPLLPVLTSAGQNDLAVFLLQSREFPSWGYEIANGATSIWERWDSYTKEDAFGRHNAAMNSFSHYAFGAVCEWMFQSLAGIQSASPGYKRIVIKPHPPHPDSNSMHAAVHWVKATHRSIRGLIQCDWEVTDDKFNLTTSIPANTTATVYLPTSDTGTVMENGRSISGHPHVRLMGFENGYAVLEVESGRYQFSAASGFTRPTVQLATSKPKDMSINPEKIDMTKAKQVMRWDFNDPNAAAAWSQRHHVKLETVDGKPYLVATGDDSQFAITLPAPLRGKLVIELRANPGKGADTEWFWAGPGKGFSGQQQSSRRLQETDQVNAYLFAIPADDPIDKLRFDPFATFDAHANVGQMQLESIAVYLMSPP